MDFAHTETDKAIEELEKRLQAEYRQAYKETKDKLEKYLSDFARKDEAKRKLVDEGKLSQADYKKWRTNQMLTGQRWAKMVDTLARDMNRTNQIAADIISGQLSLTFALNANYAAYGIENGFQTDFGFTLYDQETVNKLVAESPDLLPKPNPNAKIDVPWNKQKISSVVTQAVLQGKAIPEIAKTMQTVVGMNKASATRNARTAMTGAQNAGRQATYDRAKAMGIKVKKEWIATLDGRTRHSHGKADGQQVEIDGKFKVGNSEMRYPGDPQGAAEEVYNCRCTMATVEPDYILKGGEKPKSFEKWVEDKNKPVANQLEKAKFISAKTKTEAETIAQQFGVDADYSGYDISVANAVNQTMQTTIDEFGEHALDALKFIGTDAKGKNREGGFDEFTGKLSLSGAKGKNALLKMGEKTRKTNERYRKMGISYFSAEDDMSTIHHEFGHIIHVSVGGSTTSTAATALDREIIAFMRDKNADVINQISYYATLNHNELIAECVAQYMAGNPSEIASGVVDILKKYGSKNK